MSVMHGNVNVPTLFLRPTFFYVGISTSNTMVCIDSSDGWIMFQRVVFVSMQLLYVWLPGIPSYVDV